MVTTQQTKAGTTTHVFNQPNVNRWKGNNKSKIYFYRKAKKEKRNKKNTDYINKQRQTNVTQVWNTYHNIFLNQSTQPELKWNCNTISRLGSHSRSFVRIFLFQFVIDKMFQRFTQRQLSSLLTITNDLFQYYTFHFTVSYNFCKKIKLTPISFFFPNYIIIFFLLFCFVVILQDTS